MRFILAACLFPLQQCLCLKNRSRLRKLHLVVFTLSFKMWMDVLRSRNTFSKNHPSLPNSSIWHLRPFVSNWLQVSPVSDSNLPKLYAVDTGEHPLQLSPRKIETKYASAAIFSILTSAGSEGSCLREIFFFSSRIPSRSLFALYTVYPWLQSAGHWHRKEGFFFFSCMGGSKMMWSEESFSLFSSSNIQQNGTNLQSLWNKKRRNLMTTSGKMKIRFWAKSEPPTFVDNFCRMTKQMFLAWKQDGLMKYKRRNWVRCHPWETCCSKLAADANLWLHCKCRYFICFVTKVIPTCRQKRKT